jgi:hypothetical protein
MRKTMLWRSLRRMASSTLADISACFWLSMEATLRRRARHESEGDAPCCDGEEAAADEDCEDSDDDDDEEDEAEDEMRLFSTAKTVRDVPRERTGDIAWPAVTSPSRSPWRPPPPPPCMLHKRSAGRTRPHSRGVVFSEPATPPQHYAKYFF